MAIRRTFSGIGKNALIYGTATLIERAISLFMLPILTKNLLPELYGVWSQIIVTLGFLTPLVLLGFQTAIVNFFSGDEGEGTAKDRTFNRLLLIVLLISLAIIVFILLNNSFISLFLFGDQKYNRFAKLFGLLLFSEVLFEMLVAYLRSGQKIYLLSIYYLVKNAARVLILTGGLVLLNTTLGTAVTGLVIWQLLFVIGVYVKEVNKKFLEERGKTDIEMKRMKEILLFSLPLIPYTVLIWLNNFMDRYFILHLRNINEVSIYSASYAIAAILGIFYSVLGFTLYPQLARMWSQGDKEAIAELLSKSILYYMFFLIPSGFFLTFYSTPILTIFTTPDYVSNWQVVGWLCAGIGLFGLFSICIYIAFLAKETCQILKISAVSVLVNLFMNILLIPTYGILGAAIATTGSNAVLTFWTMSMIRRKIYWKFPVSDVFIIFRSACIMFIFLIATKYFFEIDSILKLLVLLLSAGIVYLVANYLSKKSILHQLGRNI